MDERTPPATASLPRRAFVGVGLTLTLALLVMRLPRLVDPGVMGVDDFVEYWSAGRLNLTHGNPYAPAQLLALQQQAGLDDEQPIMMWNPPWTLTFVMPFGLPPYAVARLCWLLFHMALILICADLLWVAFGGPPCRRWIAWLVALSFCPALIALKSGQISPLILLGLTGFLLGMQRGREALAGACLILASIKPHLVYLIWLAFLLWTLDRRRGLPFLGLTLAGLVSLGIPLLFNPQVLAQYRQATAEQPPIAWRTTTFGTLLRLGFGTDKNWLVFLPTLLGLLWFVPYWIRQRRCWNWSEQLPLLLLVSYGTASYGWLGDQVVLLLALVLMAVWVAQDGRLVLPAVVPYLSLNALDLGINIYFNQPQHQIWHLWTAPALLLGFLALRLHARGRTA